MALNGWPFTEQTNYGMTERNFRDPSAPGARSALIVPRQKYTWLAEFEINPAVFTNPLTNLQQYIKNGKLYVSLKTIDIPKIQFKIEKIRQYNLERIVPVKAEFPACSMSMYDDSSSMVAALIKEYINFYHETGNIGAGLVTGGSWYNEGIKYGVNAAQGITNYFGSPNGVTRTDMDKRSSLGMKLRPSGSRNFFYNITVYSFGSDPDSVNTYYYNRPAVTSIDHDPLDWEDRNGRITATFQFEYEGFYFTIGQPRTGNTLTALQSINPNTDAGSSPSSGHAIMLGSDTSSVPGGILSSIDANSGNSALNSILNQSTDPNASTARQPGESLASYTQRTSGLDPSALNYNLPNSADSSAPIEAQAQSLSQAQAAADPFSTSYNPQPGSTLPQSDSMTARSASADVTNSDNPVPFVPANANLLAQAQANDDQFSNLANQNDQLHQQRAAIAANGGDTSSYDTQISQLNKQMDDLTTQSNNINTQIFKQHIATINAPTTVSAASNTTKYNASYYQ